MFRFVAISCVLVLGLAGCLSSQKTNSKTTGKGKYQTGDAIFVALVADAAAYKVVFSVPQATAKLQFCEKVATNDCNATQPSFQELTAITPVGSLFVMTLTKPIQLSEDTMNWVSMNALDATGKSLGSNIVNLMREKGGGLSGKFSVEFIDIATARSESPGEKSAVLIDILNHLPPSYGNTYYDSDLVTWAHETSHGLHSDLRNNHNNTGKKVNGFYLLNDKAAIIEEPSIRKSDAVPYVPESLRSLDITGRFDTYISGSPSWDDTPTYIWDEWNAYTNGSAAAVDIVESGSNIDRNDALNGTLEFTIYALAMGQAAKEKDPQFFANNKQFVNFLGYNVERAMTIYRKGRKMSQFANSSHEAYFTKMQSSADVAPLRKFVEETYGKEWADKVVFGP